MKQDGTDSNDPYADVAITPVVIPKEVNAAHIPTDMIIPHSKRKELNIGIGNEICMVGLFSHLKGNSKNIPIVRLVI